MKVFLESLPKISIRNLSPFSALSPSFFDCLIFLWLHQKMYAMLFQYELKEENLCWFEIDSLLNRTFHMSPRINPCLFNFLICAKFHCILIVNLFFVQKAVIFLFLLNLIEIKVIVFIISNYETNIHNKLLKVNLIIFDSVIFFGNRLQILWRKKALLLN
jgi:hypothetical protein